MRIDFENMTEIVEKWRDLGGTDKTLPLLGFVPAVQVAWAEGFMQAGERRTILALYAASGIADDDLEKELLGWLDERPSDDFFAAATEILSEWLAKMSSHQSAGLRDLLHERCMKVAEASTTIGLRPGTRAVSREERRQLELIGNQLGFTLA